MSAKVSQAAKFFLDKTTDTVTLVKGKVLLVADRAQSTVNKNRRVQETVKLVREKIEVVGTAYRQGVEAVTRRTDEAVANITAKVEAAKKTASDSVSGVVASAAGTVNSIVESAQGKAMKLVKASGQEARVNALFETAMSTVEKVQNVGSRKAAEAREAAERVQQTVMDRVPSKAEVQAAMMETKAKASEMASNAHYQATAVTAVSGAAVGGTSGAAVGLVSGGTVGAAVGLIPAFFTFGLSIPVFAAIGGACGATAGAVAGGSAGLVGGAGAGYGAYQRKDKIGKMAQDSASYVRSRFSGTTGGTD